MNKEEKIITKQDLLIFLNDCTEEDEYVLCPDIFVSFKLFSARKVSIATKI